MGSGGKGIWGQKAKVETGAEKEKEQENKPKEKNEEKMEWRWGSRKKKPIGWEDSCRSI